MDLMLKISEELQEQWSKIQQKESGEGVPYRSVYTINGNPILPPLVRCKKTLFYGNSIYLSFSDDP